MIWAINYYTTDIINVQGRDYKISKQDGSLTILTSFYGPDIKVVDMETSKIVELYHHNYTIVPNAELTQYTVSYSNGTTYKIKELPPNNGLLAYDESGEPYDGATIITYNNAISSQSQFSFYPNLLVKIAFSKYYEKQGYWYIFILSFILFSFSLLLLKNKSLQMIFFHLSHGLDVVDPEPTDVYFISTKISAAIGMFISVILFFMSL